MRGQSWGRVTGHWLGQTREEAGGTDRRGLPPLLSLRRAGCRYSTSLALGSGPLSAADLSASLRPSWPRDGPELANRDGKAALKSMPRWPAPHAKLPQVCPTGGLPCLLGAARGLSREGMRTPPSVPLLPFLPLHLCFLSGEGPEALSLGEGRVCFKEGC